MHLVKMQQAAVQAVPNVRPSGARLPSTSIRQANDVLKLQLCGYEDGCVPLGHSVPGLCAMPWHNSKEHRQQRLWKRQEIAQALTDQYYACTTHFCQVKCLWGLEKVYWVEHLLYNTSSNLEEYLSCSVQDYKDACVMANELCSLTIGEQPAAQILMKQLEESLYSAI